MNENTHHPVTLVNMIVLLTALSWTGCLSSPSEPDEPSPSTISVSVSQLYLGVGESAEITAEVLDEFRWPIADAPLNWSSSDPGVAAVDSRGGCLCAYGRHG